MTTDDIQTRWRELMAQLERAQGRTDDIFDAVDELRTQLQEQLFPAGWPLERPQEVDGADPRLQLLLDAMAALSVLEPDDAAYPWERGWLLSVFGRHLEAADDYLMAARLLERDAATGTGTTGDEEEWAKSALFHAAKNLALGGHPTAAAALLPQLTADDRAEVEPLVDATASQTIL